MKTIKLIFWLIVLTFLGILFYQNQVYFMTPVALHLDLKISNWNWTIPELQNIVYFGICFLIGIFLAGIKGLSSGYKMRKNIKTKDFEINSLKEQVNTLKIRLEAFQDDMPEAQLPETEIKEETPSMEAESSSEADQNISDEVKKEEDTSKEPVEI